MKKLLLIGLTLLMLVGCSSGSKTKDREPVKENEAEKETKPATQDFSDSKNPIVTLTMEQGGVVEIELYPKAAPNTVANFVSLAQEGYYDGLIFHRIIPGFMIQGGDPDGNGMGGPGYGIEGEFKNNGFENNTLTHTKGIISMARSNQPNSAGSQFFIMTADAKHLDGDYAAFGKVTSGLDVIDGIESTPTGANDKPEEANKQVIKTITVDTKGETYTVKKS